MSQRRRKYFGGYQEGTRMQYNYFRRFIVSATAAMACAMMLPVHAATAPTAAPTASTQVSLSGAANVDGIVADGTAPTNGGLDTHDYAVSANLLGTSVNWSGVTFPIGAAGGLDAVSSATIVLPAGSYTTLKLLALGTNGNQPNQVFTVTYTDGTTTKITQSVSDWWSPQNYTGESTALSMAYCVTPSGGQCSGPQALYGYSFTINGAKTVKSLTLPKNRNVVVLNAALSGLATNSVNLAAAANVDAMFQDGTAPTNGGLIGSGDAISKNLVGDSLTWSGTTFAMGAAGVANGVTSTSVALPAGKFTALKMVAIGAQGNQANQPFVVTYTDGTSTTIKQSLSDWWHPQNNPGETTALSMAYNLTATGGKSVGPRALFGYSLPIDGTKTVKSLTLPNNHHVILLAVALTADASASASASTLALSAADSSAQQSDNAVTLMVNRSGAPSAAVSVSYATADGSGVAGSLYTSKSGTLQWAANDTSAKTITVPISNASPYAGNKSFQVTLSNPSGSASLGSPSTETVTVAGDASSGGSSGGSGGTSGASASTLQLTATSYTVAANAGSMKLSVTRTGSTSSAVSVAYATASGTASAGTNYSSASGPLNWSANDNSTKTITVAISNSSSTTGNANFNVNLSAPSGGATLGPNSAATVTITPVNPSGGSAPGGAASTLSYLSGLNQGSSRRVLSGQHADIWTADSNSTTEPMANVTPLVSQTGDTPAILALVLNYATNSYAYTVPVTNTLANNQWSKGGMVMLSLYSNDPTFSSNSSGQPGGQSVPSAAFHSLTDPSSAAYRQWHSQLDTYAAALHTLTDSGHVVLFRPFIEINGNWNWYGAENAADFIAVWKDMHDYLTITKGVKNLLWIYNVNQNVGSYMDYYPGSNYVDIVGMDLYQSSPVSAANAGSMYSQLVATGKPVIIPEIGLSASGPANYTQDDMVIINSIKTSLPNVVAFVAFNGGFSIGNQNNAAALMNDPWIVNASNLPSSQ